MNEGEGGCTRARGGGPCRAAPYRTGGRPLACSRSVRAAGCLASSLDNRRGVRWPGVLESSGAQADLTRHGLARAARAAMRCKPFLQQVHSFSSHAPAMLMPCSSPVDRRRISPPSILPAGPACLSVQHARGLGRGALCRSMLAECKPRVVAGRRG